MNSKSIAMNFVLGLILTGGLIGLYWLHRLGISAGSAYLELGFIGLVFILVTVVAYISTKKGFYFEVPISKNGERALVTLFLGILFMLTFVFLSSITNLQFYSPFIMAPLAFGNLQIGGVETFEALQAVTSPFWTVFISVIGASVMEESVLGYAFVAIGAFIIGYALRKIFKLDFGTYGNNLFDFIGAIAFSILLFSVFHWFNGTYLNVDGTWKWGMFFYAAGFRGVINIFMYKFGNFGLSFGIGVHAVNNAIYLGWDVIKEALYTMPGGLIIIIILMFLFIYAIIGFKNLWDEGELIKKDFITDFE